MSSSEVYHFRLSFSHAAENLGFYQNRVLKGYIEDDGGTRENRMNFTGQHRCFIKDIPYSNINYIGRIVCANQNTYISMSNTIKKEIKQSLKMSHCHM